MCSASDKRMGSMDGPKSRRGLGHPRARMGPLERALEDTEDSAEFPHAACGTSSAIRQFSRCGRTPTRRHSDAWAFARRLGAKSVQFERNSIRVGWPDRREPPGTNPPTSRKAAIRKMLRIGLRWDQDWGRWVMTDSTVRALQMNGFHWDEGLKQWVKLLRQPARRKNIRR